MSDEERVDKARTDNLHRELETTVEKMLEQQLPERFSAEVEAVTKAMTELAKDTKADAEARVRAARAVYSIQNDSYIFYFNRAKLLSSWFNAKGSYGTMKKVGDAIEGLVKEQKRQDRPAWLDEDDEE